VVRWAGEGNWISSPTTQNGVVRIVSHPKYSNAQPVPIVLESLDSLTRVGEHRFVPDAVSLLGDEVVRRNLLSSSQVTDTYLVQLAVSLGARLATFDMRLVTTAVSHAEGAVFHIPSSVWPVPLRACRLHASNKRKPRGPVYVWPDRA
jgi:uncharacterized protein